jgi:dihydropyrimidine dehydrogenase (NAD+) subunit PreT
MALKETAPKLTEEQYEDNFKDMYPALTKAEAYLESSRCLYCYEAPCTVACPADIDVPAFIKKIATGNVKGSAREILVANPMGHSCARTCPVEVLCEGACVMNDLQRQPIDIDRLQRFATDYALEKKLKLFEPGADTGKRVAIIGGGPAGLSCAQYLRFQGHAVTVFEAKPLPGGLNTYGMADYKMKVQLSLDEVQMILDLGVDLKVNTRFGDDISFEELDQEFDAVFFGIGLGSTRKMAIPGENLKGVVEALDFIEALKIGSYQDVEMGRNVIVVGAGNTAIDCVTQAKRLGAESSTIVYRRSREEMPAYDYEYEIGKKDACEFRWLTSPVRVVGTDYVEGLECVKMELGDPDSSGRRVPQPIEGSEHILEADMIIYATGQEAWKDAIGKIPGVVMDGKRIQIDKETAQTGNPKVFAGGDCTNGGHDLVNAAAAGKLAAQGINDFLASH